MTDRIAKGRRKHVVFAALAFAVAALATDTAGAAIMVFTSRADWEAAVGTFQTEDFESTPLGTLPGGTTTNLGLVDFSYPGAPSGSPAPRIRDSGTVNGTRELVGHIFDPGAGGGTTNPGPHTITFASPIWAFGADFESTLSGDNVTVTFAGMTIKFSDFLIAPGNGFLGVVADTTFSTIVFGTEDASGYTAELFSIDDLSFSVAETAVPEPGMLGLVALGLAGLGVAARRRRGLSG